MPLRKAKTEYFWLWQRVQAKPTLPFKSSGDYGRQRLRNASCSWPIAISSLIKPCSKTSPPLVKSCTRSPSRQAKKNYEVYLALYQAVTGNEEWKQTFRQFPCDFFDLVVIDECHRGSAAENSAWREVLDYFGSATHLGTNRHTESDQRRIQQPLTLAIRFTPTH